MRLDFDRKPNEISKEQEARLRHLIQEVVGLGLDEEVAKEFESAIGGPYPASQLGGELFTLKLLSRIHDLDGENYVHEYEVDGGSSHLDHVFTEEKIAYEQTAVTWEIDELLKITNNIHRLVEWHRKKGRHTQVSRGPDAVVTTQNRISSENVNSITEVEYTPVELASETAEKITEKADKKAKELRKFDGHRIAIVDLRYIYWLPDMVIRRVRKRLANAGGSLGKIDGVLLMVTDMSGDGESPGFLPLLHPETSLSQDKFEPIVAEKPAVPQSMYVPAANFTAEKGWQNIMKKRGTRLIFADEVEIEPLTNKWILAGFLDPDDNNLTSIELTEP